ncbi:MAG: STAS domain-containing protein [Planctomycetota bacterium]|jgi:anti-anti-sigma factor
MNLSTVSDDGHVLRLQAAGPITQDGLSQCAGDELGDLLGAEGYARRAVLGMADVDFIDTSGIGWLLARHKRFREAGGVLVIHSVVPMVLEVLKVLRLHMVFRLAENEPAALAAVRGDQS